MARTSAERVTGGTRHVAARLDGLAAGVPHQARRLGQAGHVAVGVDDDPRALVRKLQRDAASDPARGTGNQGHFPA
jgi:hypothetical protein